MRFPVWIKINTGNDEWLPSFLVFENTLEKVLRRRRCRDFFNLQQIGVIQVRSVHVSRWWIQSRCGVAENHVI